VVLEELPERVAAEIARHRMFRPGDRVGVAVSGGADSVALLHLLVELAPRWNLTLRVLHVDHGLRGEASRQDARFVAELAARFGLGFELREADVRAMARAGGENLEQAARRLRLEFFHGLVARGTLDRVALGHTRTDQAETVLFRLLRGAGITGLAGIWPVTSEGLVRPLLGVDRREVRRYLERRQIGWREDASNRDLALARNRIRLELLPQLERDWNPALVQALARLAAVAQQEERYWEAEIGRLAAEHLTRQGPAVLVRCSRLRELPEAVARRLVRYAVGQAKGDTRRLEFDHVARILELAAAREGCGEVAIPDLEVRRSFDWLRLAPPQPAPGYSFAVAAPGRYVLPGGGRAILLEAVEWEGGYNTVGETHLDWNVAAAGLVLRSWQPGDKFQRAGRTHGETMKELFQRARIPSWERAGWPMLTSGGTIVWTRRFGVAEGCAALPGARRTLRVQEIEDAG